MRIRTKWSPSNIFLVHFAKLQTFFIWKWVCAHLNKRNPRQKIKVEFSWLDSLLPSDVPLSPVTRNPAHHLRGSRPAALAMPVGSIQDMPPWRPPQPNAISLYHQMTVSNLIPKENHTHRKGKCCHATTRHSATFSLVTNHFISRDFDQHETRLFLEPIRKKQSANCQCLVNKRLNGSRYCFWSWT